ncbi:glycosyltransferase family 2 protein [Streptacidiphilus sp. P02-A3a]|nr:glycosyltransferase family 2 protein [Streptacidiphilus sp. P02-A3a]
MITPVYNTRPYLDAWFESLLAQTMGTARIQVLAVDDGSDDGSAEELLRLAGLHPELLTAVPLDARRGPAHARNLGLERATGRYLFFLDSDDRLGPEALARMVAAADEHGTDVVLGRVVGVNGRWVPVGACRRTDPEVPFPSADLVWSLTPSKLFRHSLVREHRLRFREELPAYSDGPFVLEACFLAGRVSVLADYDYYYLVARADAGNITYSSRLGDRLLGIAAGVEVTVRHTAPGPERDLVNARHLRGDLANLFRAPFLELPRAEQEQLCAAARPLLAAHLTERIRGWCTDSQRLRLHCVEHGLLDELITLVRYEARHDQPPEPLAVTGAAWVPGSRRPPGRAPVLELRAEQPLPLPGLRVAPVALALPVAAGSGASGSGPRPAAGHAFAGVVGGADQGYLVRIPLASLIPQARRPDGAPGGAGRPRGRWAVRLDTDYAGQPTAVPVPLPADPALPPLRWWHRGRPYRATPLRGADGGLVLAIAPIRIRRVLGLRVRRLLPALRVPDRFRGQ